MDHIKEALIKARATVDRQPTREHRESLGSIAAGSHAPVPKWEPPLATLNAEQLESHRIVSFAMRDPAYKAFNLLRTRVRKALSDNQWKTVAITSPTPGCGKTMVAINLALSLARTPNCRTILIDFDLKKPAIARTLGIVSTASIGSYLEGLAAPEECFVKVSVNLFIGLNSHPIEHSSELLHGSKVTDLIAWLSMSLCPDVILFDLPPMRAGDDALAFLPSVDAALLVAASGKTTTAEIDETERQISNLGKLLGVVLNKCDLQQQEYYY